MDNPDSRLPGTPSAMASWGPDRRIRWISLAVAVFCIAWGAIRSAAEDRLVAGVAAALFLVVMVLLIRIRVRLAVGATGLTITGPLRTRLVPWTAVDTITMPRRGRFGRRGATLEIEIRPEASAASVDASGGQGGAATAPPDTELLVFAAFELGADPAAVGRQLIRIQRSRTA